MQKKILITGGTGYIGGRLSKYLYEKMQDASILIASRARCKYKNFWHDNADFIILDLTQKQVTDEICANVDTVIHLAALNENQALQNPEEAILINTVGTLKLLNCALKNGVRRFIYLSTAHVYGAPLEGLITEHSLTKPIHPYAITHKTAEDFILSAAAQGKIEGIILRLSNSFGAPINPAVDRWTLLVNDLAKQTVVNQEIKLKSFGLQERDFITLTDVCRAVEYFINLPYKLCSDGIFNLGGDYTLSVFEMAKLIAKRCKIVLGYDVNIIRSELSAKEIISVPLEYSVCKLKNTNFKLEKNIFTELDNMLLFCQSNFVFNPSSG